MGKKISVVMVCAHEPSLDPRIRWEAESASSRFDVTVLGFNRTDKPAPEVERRDGYLILRRPHIPVSGLYYFWRLKDAMPRWLVIAGCAVLVPLAPIIVLAEILVRLIVGGLRPILRLMARGLRRLRTLAVAWRFLGPMMVSARHRLMGRLPFIAAVLRMQFAPAVSSFWNHLREVPRKPDVVHCNDLDTLLVGILAKVTYGSRVVYDAHEFWPVADSLCKWSDITFFSLIERFLIRKADAVVTVNPLLAEEIRRSYRLTRVHSVPNVEPWVEERVSLDRTSAMSELAAGRVKFLFQGRFTVARGIDELIRAWPSIDRNRAALFLRGPDNNWRRGMMEEAARLGVLDDSVYFLDAVSEDELVSAAAEADVGIVPYLPLAINERLSCPNKLSQYLHAGLMVVTNDLPYVRSVVEEAGAGLWYDSRKLATLVDVAHRIIDDPELLERCRENARRFARQEFNWQRYQHVFFSLYEGGSDGSLEGEKIAEAVLPLSGETAPRGVPRQV